MTFPAELTFKRDTSLPPTARRVYDYLTTVLDFREPRRIVIELHCAQIKTDRETFGRALNTLVTARYLVEHDRDPRGVRRFTLAWSIPVDDAEEPI